MIKITLLILYIQVINSGICWSPGEPLIVNIREDKAFFPVYVNKQNAESDSPAAMTYIDPSDKTSSTYAFCKDRTDYSPIGARLLGALLNEKTPKQCEFSINFSRDQVKVLVDDVLKPVPCGEGSEDGENTGYWKYKVYFKLLIDNKELAQDSYEYCYDHNHSLNTLYAYYDLNNPSLLKNEYLAEEQNYEVILKKPRLDGPYEVDLLTRIYDEQDEFEPYQVAVSEFIPFGHWRKSFYQWHNTAPLNKILRKPWKTFITNVRAKLAEKTEPIKVVSGIHGIKYAQGSIQYLPHSKITIPLVRWIVLLNNDKTKGVALIMHNYVFGSGEPEPVPWCPESQCDNAGLKDVLPPPDRYGRKAKIYCCAVSKITPIVALPPEILSPAEDLLIFE